MQLIPIPFELQILEECRLGPYPNATHPGTALMALKHGFKVDYLHIYKNIFVYPYGYPPDEVMSHEEFELKLSIDLEYIRQALRKGLKLVRLPSLTADELRTALRKGPILAMVDYSGSLHDIIIQGFDGNTFSIVDPAKGYITYSERTLLHLVNTRYGVSLLNIYK